MRIHLAKYFDDISIGLFQRDETRKALEALTKVLTGTNPIKEQLRKERTPREFADWIFDIDPYSVTYSLEYDKKDLKFSLSPGEKGIVLLLLYLKQKRTIKAANHRPDQMTT